MIIALTRTGVALCLAVFASFVQAQIGVGSSGQATYGYPIVVPPGIAGMAPNLSLAYADGGINGPLGVGWSLQGVSMITRCPATKAVDGAAGAVKFGSADKLCLDGQRLIQTDETGAPLASQIDDAMGLSGTSVREFRTEKDSFARIRAYGRVSADAADGPAYFRVWTKSGQIYEYGRSPETETDTNAVITVQGKPTVMVWSVRRIKDVLGSFIEFGYQQRNANWGSGTSATGLPGREWNLVEVRYTGTATGAPSNRVRLEYDDRPSSPAPTHDASETYQAGRKNVSLQRLKAIRTYINSNATEILVRTYNLGYNRGASGRSRLVRIQECAGTAATACLPPTSFTYTDRAQDDVRFDAQATFATGALARLKFIDAAGRYGVLTGDFDGDGLTDIVRWSASVSENQVHLSNGDGGFTKVADPKLGKVLFSADGCFKSMVADFTGDGMSDILRTVQPGCSTEPSTLFVSTGGGVFKAVPVNPAIGFGERQVLMVSTPPGCMWQIAPGSVAAQRHGPGPAATTSVICTGYSYVSGQRYYVIDANGDGFLDIVLATFPSMSWDGTSAEPSPQTVCATLICTRLFLGSSDGTFAEAPTNVAHNSLYGDAAGSAGGPYWRRPNVADIDGDGLQDIITNKTGIWRSLGNGNFQQAPESYPDVCALAVDFNGDGRADCLSPAAVASQQTLTVALATKQSGSLAQFDLSGSTDNLFAQDGSFRQTVGVVVDDFDGDGRQDLLRWGQSAGDNGIYFSRGDGSFRPRVAAGLGALGRPLQAVDGVASFVLGDFLGTGAVQILHIKQDPPATGGDVDSLNQLYAQSGSSAPGDQLLSVTTSTGLVHSVKSRQPLTAVKGRYTSDRGKDDQATGSQVDLQLPIYVVTTTSADTGVGLLDTEYAYKGLKAERAGRGLLGFREVRVQRPAPDGSALTTVSRYLQVHPFIGVPSVVTTFNGELSSSGSAWISRTTNAYCDKTSSTAPQAATPGDPPAPCASKAKVQRPYLYQVIEQGKELDGTTSLPTLTTTNTYNNTGDPLTITVVTEGTALGLKQTFTKLTENTYFSATTTGDNWVLGRLKTAKVTNTVPNSFAGIPAASGTSPCATEIEGASCRAAIAAVQPPAPGEEAARPAQE